MGQSCFPSLAWIAAVVLARFAISPLPANADTPLTFEQHIRPILKAHCFDCHGEGDQLKGGLDLRLVRFIIRGGDSGPALVPGEPDSSRVYQLVRSGEMPKRERKLASHEIDLLKRWIASGARTAREEPESLPKGMHITPEERAHWAFQPITRPPVPAATNERIRNPIDSFIAEAFPSPELSFSPDASRRSLIRRAYIDLWGLPPSPEEVETFLADSRPDAYERLVDRLLESPRYGERWGRHWLDVAGYADSEGYTSEDLPRPYAYKYRDYVIRAFNRDVPFDQFLLEQLAGDELALARHQSLESAAQDPIAREWLVATGFLRMAADGTGSRGVDRDLASNQVIADTIKIVSTSLLGLSIGCAQCHDHRYDPIPQTDYYRLRAVFEPAYNWKNWRKPSERLISLYTSADREKAAQLEEEAAKLAAEKKEKQAAAIDEALKKHLEKFDESLREPLWLAFKTPADQRTEEQKQLLKAHPSVNIHPGVLYQYNPKAAEELKAMDAKIAEIRARKPPEDFIRALWESGDAVPVTYRFHRGDHTQPKEAIGPATLTVLAQIQGMTAPGTLENPDGLPGTTGRRLAFARWLTGPNNPLLPRVIVNRVWMHHFGRGLVGTPADFGLQGERPSHPELLDWLASVFIAPLSDGAASGSKHGLGWSLKRLHRLIMTSTTYRQASIRDPYKDAVDPENRFYWRKSIQRLDAEAIRDSFLAVSGVLSGRMFGPPVPVREDVVGQIVIGIDKKEGDNKMPVDVPMGEEEFRRSVYVEVRRTRPLAFLNTFDAPVMEVNCELRASSTAAPQALMLMNSDFALQQARLFAGRLKKETGGNRERCVERAWKLAFGRAPSDEERREAARFLADQTALFAERPAPEKPSKAKEKKGDPDAPPPTPEEYALQSLCQILLSSNEFLYVD